MFRDKRFLKSQNWIFINSKDLIMLSFVSHKRVFEVEKVKIPNRIDLLLNCSSVRIFACIFVFFFKTKVVKHVL